MASPPHYSTQPARAVEELVQGDATLTPQVVLHSSLPDRTSDTVSSISSEATLPVYASPSATETRRTGSLRKDDKHSSIGSSLASTEAARRLRDAEEEVRRLRELNQRLRAEGAKSSSLSPARIRSLREAAKASSDDAHGRKINAGLFKQVCSTDLLFLVDTTASMSGSINAAKEQVKSIVNDINLAFLGEAEVRIAVVGYKDHQDSPNIESLDFTKDVNKVRSFIDGLRATGGGDTPEDMLGGMQRALQSNWLNQTRCIIHIADAPPHGRVNHDLGDGSDRYATPGSEPHSLHYQPLVTKMIGLNINYALLRITNLTDRCALNFFKVYLAAGSDCTLHTSNKYYKESCSLIDGASSSYLSSNSSFRSSKAKLQFEEAELGTSYEKLRHLVLRNVTTSASRTAVRLSAGSGSSGLKKPKFESKLMSSGMGAIMEDEDNAPPEVVLETVAPQWEKKGWFNETLTLEGFSPDVGVHGASTLNDMMEDDENIKMSITELTVNKRSKPFAQGAMRVAAYARTKDSKNRFVVKSFKKQGKKLAHLAEDMRCQALCKAFALEFSALVGEESSLDFIVTTCLRSKGRASARDEHLSLEPLIEGTYIKYTNNTSWVNRDKPDDPINLAAQAFSHFTFERSRGRFLVSDLQGVGRLLTDPAIHTRDEQRFKLSDTNLGREGFKFFFSSHECNDLCHKLKLQSNRSMFVSGIYVFRDDWPDMGNVVCCSNKLCGKILQVGSRSTLVAKEYPGHHWCSTCFHQLNAQASLLCVSDEGPQHEFKVSRFFYESQGRTVPRLCGEHREEEKGLFKTETKVITDKYRSMPGAFRNSIDEEDGFPHISAEEDEIRPVSSSETSHEVVHVPPAPPLPDFTANPYRPAVPKAADFSSWDDLHEPASSASFWADSFSKDEVKPYSVAAALPYTPYAATSVAKTKKRTDGPPAAASRLSLSGTGGGFWSKLKKRSLSFKPSMQRLGKKE